MHMAAYRGLITLYAMIKRSCVLRVSLLHIGVYASDNISVTLRVTMCNLGKCNKKINKTIADLLRNNGNEK